MSPRDSKIAEALPAASILLIRDSIDGLEVLMMERAKTMRFAPGAFVFPGGKVDADDCDHAQWLELSNTAEVCDDLHYRVAVLRELYEETSVLLLESSVGSVDVGRSFQECLAATGSRLDTESLVRFAHWVTPETMPRRFDTHFYLAAHNGLDAIHDGDEAVSLRWVTPKKLLNEWDADLVPLMFPTRLNLLKLARASTVDEAMEQARKARVVRTMPVVGHTAEGVSVSIDATSGYGATTATEKELRVERPK